MLQGYGSWGKPQRKKKAPRPGYEPKGGKGGGLWFHPPLPRGNPVAVRKVRKKKTGNPSGKRRWVLLPSFHKKHEKNGGKEKYMRFARGAKTLLTHIPAGSFDPCVGKFGGKISPNWKSGKGTPFLGVSGSTEEAKVERRRGWDVR